MLRGRTFVIAILAAWTALLLVTHRGSRSPYTYVPQALGEDSAPVDRLVNRDALSVVPVTRFFYDGTRPDWPAAHNMKLPTHSFAVATVAAFVRPYLAANDVTNFAFTLLLIVAAIRLATRYGIRDRAMLLALATLLALPPFVGYLGQPMHYIVGPVINALVLMIALALPDRDLRNPWIAGALTAILTLNYDWYVFGAALVIYVLAVLRFERRRDDLIYLAVSIAPVAMWRWFLHTVSGNQASTVVRDAFIETVIVQWSDFFRDPARHILMPFIASHIGMHIGIHEVLALIHWPLLLCCAVALWKARPGPGRQHLLLLVVAVFFVEQLVTAVFDVENNPRRALPVVVVVGCLYCWVVDLHLDSRRWKAAFLVLLALTAFLAFADVALGRPGAASLYMGESIRLEPKLALSHEAKELVIASSSAADQAPVRIPFPRARIELAGPWLFAQGFLAFWFFVLFALLRRAELLPRHAPIAFAAVWLLSAARFL